MFKAVADGFNNLFHMLANLFGKLMDGLYWLLQPLFSLLEMIFQFITYIGIIIVKIVYLVFTVAKMLIGLGAGLTKTIFGFGYSGRAVVLPHKYQDAFDHLTPWMSTIQMDRVAYVAKFIIWFFTAFIAIKIIGAMRGGGGES